MKLSCYKGIQILHRFITPTPYAQLQHIHPRDLSKTQNILTFQNFLPFFTVGQATFFVDGAIGKIFGILKKVFCITTRTRTHAI